MRERTLNSAGFSLTGPFGAPARRGTERQLSKGSVSPPVRWAFCAFVFSLLFEAVPIGIPVEMTQITGVLLAVTAFLQPYVCLRRFPKALWCFVAYFCACVVSLTFQRALFQPEITSRLFVLIQLLFLFWISFNLMQYERVARAALKSFIASCAVLSVLSLLGLTPTTHEKLAAAGRFTAFGLDPNQMAGLLSLGVLALIGLTYGLDKALLRPRLLMWPLVGLVGFTLVSTGSRGGLVALGAGLMALVLRKGTISTKARNTLLVLMGVGFFVALSYRSDTVTRRFEKTVETGDTAARAVIYPTAFGMFLDKPVIGWGPTLNRREIAERVGIPRFTDLDAHNLVLYLLTATGLIGTIPFLIGVGLCARSAWKARDGTHGILPFAMIVAALTACMSVSGVDWKQFWFVLAYALASSNLVGAINMRRIAAKPLSPAGRPDRRPVDRILGPLQGPQA